MLIQAENLLIVTIRVLVVPEIENSGTYPELAEKWVKRQVEHFAFLHFRPKFWALPKPKNSNFRYSTRRSVKTKNSYLVS